ncbi:polysaccharide pyruvyl transferase family protein [Cupriavidus sp. SK-4]|uniref:polysaccharide pyruvyl transferase family protein n=1 Tax=Cupriavidus sp. SK-4 TaxID=574750 RepID=UPI000690149A|nr:polysaccharide pyruvyl transferase family protein [Cupriavidus sp. SK-4]
MSHNVAQMDRLKQRLSNISEYIPADQPIAYLDLPIHLNVGDLLINAGTEQFLHDYGLAVDIRLSVKNYKRFLHRITPQHTILLHGGGNFGDIWPAHEGMREQVLKKFQTNRIVMLPQTVHFRDEKNIDRTLQKYRELDNCTIFVRDNVSREFLTSHLRRPVLLSPDMAHQLWDCNSAWSKRSPGASEMRFLRRDKESTEAALGGSVDWDDLISPSRRLSAAPAYALIKYSIDFNMQQAALASWYRQRDAIINLARSRFLEYEGIATNRLHAMILAKLLGKRVNMLDNSYGKLSSYAGAWFH